MLVLKLKLYLKSEREPIKKVRKELHKSGSTGSEIQIQIQMKQNIEWKFKEQSAELVITIYNTNIQSRSIIFSALSVCTMRNLLFLWFNILFLNFYQSLKIAEIWKKADSTSKFQ